MKWRKLTQHRTSVVVNNEMYDIICEESDGEIILKIDGAYVCDLTKLPTYEEVLGYINDQITLNELSRVSFPSSLNGGN